MERRLLTITVLLTAFITLCMGANQEGTLHCLRTGNKWTMRLVILSKGDTITTLAAINLASEPMIAECSTDNSDNSAFVKGSGLDDDPFIIEIIWVDGVLQSETDCGAAKLSPPGKFEWLFEARSVEIRPEFESLIFSGDVQYYVNCDFPSLTDTLKMVNKGVTVTGETLRVLEPTEEAVSLTIHTTNTHQADIVELGTEIALVLELTPKQNGATGVYAFDCRACDKDDCSNYVYPLLDDKGCIAENNHMEPVGGSGFTGSARKSRTADFPSFRFVSIERMVWFECKVDFCFNGENMACEDYCSYRKLRRKRRAAEKEQEVISVLLVGNHDASAMIVSNIKHDSEEPCQENFAYMIAVIVLSVVLLSFVSMSAVLFIRLRRPK